MFAHAIVSSALFSSIGILYDRYKTRLLFYYGGLVLLMIVSSCNNKKNVVTEIKIAKTVPVNYLPLADDNFVKHQDTLYYGNKYFTGYQYSLFPGGDTQFVYSYFNGVEEGPQKLWYNNKQLAESRFYINGKKESLQQAWWPDGKQKFIYTATGDEFTGELKEWNSAGLLCKCFHYTNGQEEGSERMWWDDGTVRANYVIRNGKKYGLTGIKLCTNPYDSVTKK